MVYSTASENVMIPMTHRDAMVDTVRLRFKSQICRSTKGTENGGKHRKADGYYARLLLECPSSRVLRSCGPLKAPQPMMIRTAASRLARTSFALSPTVQSSVLQGLRGLSTAETPLFEDLIITKGCAKRILALRESRGDDGLHLRLAVDSGGCSGFQYSFEMEEAEKTDEDDRVFERDGATVVVDESSMEFVRGATVDFAVEMIRSSFVVVNNPNSESACGCGSSFALKNFGSNPALD
eukprot:scaffold3581_cov252-Pinguiococcus_pyrenoidosus.AAC.15